jgi:hypothetical protein
MLGRPLFIRDLEVYAPVEVAVFLALSLADRRGGWKGFLRTILLGIPLMIGLEVGILCVASGPELLGIRGQLRTVWHEMSYYIVKSILWVDPLVAWLLVGGGWGVLAGRERSRADGKAQGSSPQKRRDRMRAIGPIPSTGRRST